MSTKALLYCRVSGDDRRGATSSIEAQLADCTHYCEQHGYEIVGTAVEEPNRATSGADWLPELDRVLRLATTRSFDVLVCRDVSRLARNRFKQMAVKIELEKHGTRIEYTSMQFDDSPEGRLLEGLVSEFADYEREAIRRRMVSGQRRSVAAGSVKVGDRKPYGYRVVVHGKTRALEIDPDQSAVIRLVYDLYVNQAMTIYSIAKYLNDHGVPTPQPKTRSWSHGTLYNLLSSEVVNGRWHYSKYRLEKDPVTGKRTKRVAQPREEWIEVPVPAIIDDQLWQAAQARRQANRNRGKAHVNFYVLGGLLRCDQCGASMTGLTKKGGQQWYACCRRFGHQRHPATDRCDAPYQRAAEVDQAVWGWLSGILTHPRRLRAELAKHQKSLEQETSPLVRLLESSRAKLTQLESEKERLVQAYMASVLTLDELTLHKTTADKAIADVTATVQSLTTELDAQRKRQVDIRSVEELVRAAAKDIRAMKDDPQAQRQLYHQLNLSVTLGANGEERWADISCSIGRLRVITGFKTGSITNDCDEAGWMVTGTVRVATTPESEPNGRERDGVLTVYAGINL